MTNRSSRRADICEAALDLAAERGNHAVSHQAIDKRLGIAQGSTSYYYRTRQALIDAAIDHLATRSRTEFESTVDDEHPTVETASILIAAQMDLLLGARRRDVMARYALLTDAVQNHDLRRKLGGCLFSLTRARELTTALGADNPDSAAHNLISLLEGLLFARIFALDLEPGTSRTDVQSTVELWLEALTRRDFN